MENTAATNLAPIDNKARIQSIDTLRGVALFGILLMNIIAFAFPLAAYSDPTVDGSTEGINLAVFVTMDVFVEGSMRAIFSMLFGAGLLIFVAKPDANPDYVKKLFYRRTWFLIMFGLINAYIFVWVGDILYAYGVAGLVLYFFKDLPAKKLASYSIGIFILLGIIHSGGHYNTKALREQVVIVEALPAGTLLTAEQEETLDAWDQMLEQQFASPELIQEDLEQKRSGYVENFIASAKLNIFLQTFILIANNLWDVLAMMLLGMAFFKWGLLDASRSLRFYTFMTLIGFGIGLPLNIWETTLFVDSGFELYWSAGLRPTYDISRLSMAIAYIGLIMMICKSGVLSWFRSSLAAVGKMALTNYLSQSVICNFIFMGFGFGLAGELERHQVYIIVGEIWLFQLIFSVLWLKYYRFGPVEWLWRSLTYKQKQAMTL